MRKIHRMAACALSAMTLAGCAATPIAPVTVTKEAPASVRTVTVAPAAVRPPTTDTTTAMTDDTSIATTAQDTQTPGDPPSDSPPSTAAVNWTMPNMVGLVLQDAQDKMQVLTGNPMFYTASTDASGAGRMQVLDSNWQVCSQTPAAGTQFGSDTSVSFAAVKLAESCP